LKIEENPNLEKSQTCSTGNAPTHIPLSTHSPEVQRNAERQRITVVDGW